VYVSAAEGDRSVVLRFLSGHHLDDGAEYLSRITTLPMSNDTSSYSGLNRAVTGVYVYVYVYGSVAVQIGDDVVHHPSGWTRDWMITVSDGAMIRSAWSGTARMLARA
jgi:hypothetical protein